MSVSYEVLVVGAGAMGAATAWHAARLSSGDVLLVDKDQVCSGTSARGVGLVSRLLQEPHDIGLVERSRQWFGHLDEAASRSFDYHETGSLLILGPQHEDEVDRLMRVWRAQAIDVRSVAPDRVPEIPGCEGLKLDASEHGFFTEQEGWCVTSDAVQAMVAQARQHGAEVRTEASVDRVEEGRVRLASGESIEAEAIVIAAGVHSRQLIGEGWRPPLDAYRPQAAVLEHSGASGGPIVHDAVKGTYWRSEGPGRVMIGNGTDLDSHDPDEPVAADPHFAPLVAERFTERWPEASEVREVRSWAGLEAATPDARPLVGAVPGQEQTYLCTGGNGFGFMRATALGEALAHQILGKGPPIALHGCHPSRFDADVGTGFPMREGFSLG